MTKVLIPKLNRFENIKISFSMKEFHFPSLGVFFTAPTGSSYMLIEIYDGGLSFNPHSKLCIHFSSELLIVSDELFLSFGSGARNLKLNSKINLDN